MDDMEDELAGFVGAPAASEPTPEPAPAPEPGEHHAPHSGDGTEPDGGTEPS